MARKSKILSEIISIEELSEKVEDIEIIAIAIRGKWQIENTSFVKNTQKIIKKKTN